MEVCKINERTILRLRVNFYRPTLTQALIVSCLTVTGGHLFLPQLKYIFTESVDTNPPGGLFSWTSVHVPAATETYIITSTKFQSSRSA